MFVWQAGKYKIAVRYYKQIIDYLKNEESLNGEDGEKRKALMLAAHLNLAMCYLKLSEDVDACRSCDDALALDPKNEKGLFRRGMVRRDRARCRVCDVYVGGKVRVAKLWCLRTYNTVDQNKIVYYK